MPAMSWHQFKDENEPKNDIMKKIFLLLPMLGRNPNQEKASSSSSNKKNFMSSYFNEIFMLMGMTIKFLNF